MHQPGHEDQTGCVRGHDDEEDSPLGVTGDIEGGQWARDEGEDLRHDQSVEAESAKGVVKLFGAYI